jgi:hypothetical protein
MKYVDKLYDKRYGWINFRINIESGTLPKINRLAAEQEKKLEDLIEKLLMLNS